MKNAAIKTGTDAVLNKYKIAKSLMESIKDQLNGNYLINGKSINAWYKHFELNISDEATPAECKAISAKIFKYFQMIRYYYNLSDLQSSISQGFADKVIKKSFKDIKEHYDSKRGTKVKPTDSALKLLAEETAEELISISILAEFEKRFWKGMLEQLSNLHNCVNTIAMSNGTEGKIIASGGSDI